MEPLRLIALLTLFAGCLPELRAADGEIQATNVFSETFDSDQRGWSSRTPSPDRTARVSGGFFSWENHHAHAPQGMVYPVVVSMRRHPEYSFDVRFRAGDVKSSAGLRWGTSEDHQACLYFILSANGHYRIGRGAGGTLTDAASGDAKQLLRADAFNRLTVRVLGERTAFFVNGAVVWVGPTEQPPGNMLGSVVEAGGTADFDNLQLGYLRVEEPVIAGRLAVYAAAAGDPAKVFLDSPGTAAGGLTFDSTRSEQDVPLATLQAWFQEGFGLARQYRYEEAEKLFRTILRHNPEDAASHVQLAWCLLNRNLLPEAKAHAELALLIDPLGLGPALIVTYVTAAAGDWAAAGRMLDASFFLDFEGTVLPFVQTDVDDLIRSGRGPAYADRLKAMLAERYANRSADFAATGAALTRLSQASARGDYVEAEQHARAAVTETRRFPVESSFVPAYVRAIAGVILAKSDDMRRARSFLEEAYILLQRAGPTVSAYMRAQNAALLAELAWQSAEAGRAGEIAAANLEAALALPTAANRLKAELLYTACKAENELQQFAGLRAHAGRLLEIRETGRDRYYQALAHNFIGASYVISTLPPDRQRAREAFERALGLAQQGGYDDLASSITANTALSYWQAGERERAIKIYLENVAFNERKQNFLGAETALNNLAWMQFFADDFAGAAGTLRHAVALNETARAKLAGEERIHFLASRESAYALLVACVQRTGHAAELFEVTNSSRARALAETLNLGAPPPAMTLAQFQSTLGPDEAAIFYTITGPVEIVAQVVTRESATSAQLSDYPGFVGLKKKYLDRQHVGRPGYKPTGPTEGADRRTYVNSDIRTQIKLGDFDDMVELVRGLIDRSVKAPPEMRAKVVPEFLGAFQQLLIAPLEPSLRGKQKLIIFPDGILNFLPFEALPDAAGRYLVERFDVRYCQSAAVWQLLRARHYPTKDRRQFLGMGGAVFSAMQETALPIENQTRLVELQLRAHRNVLANRPQREVFAAIFGSKPMNYLAGSFAEVQTLSAIFEEATVFTGEDMTENRIKAMARDGSLRQYRVIHLATHGFALPDLPELSGVAMSIFPTAQGGEDGYLTAPEIARLGLQADLTVLSACETALGRIYGGEGVAGLTGALLMGGSNRALVSLWPVSDAGTMYFMQQLYTLTVTDGKTYDEAVNLTKRHFIEGKFGQEFRDIHIWAPFVHYGL